MLTGDNRRSKSCKSPSTSELTSTAFGRVFLAQQLPLQSATVSDAGKVSQKNDPCTMLEVLLVHSNHAVSDDDYDNDVDDRFIAALE